MTTRRFPKLVPLLCAAALSFGALACGDDDDDDDVVTPDADTTDASPPIDADTTDATPDAAPLVSTRSGAIAIADVFAPQIDVAGLSIDIGFVDLSTVTVPPAFNDNLDLTTGGCTVFVYNVGTDSEPTEVDEGTVTITNTVHPVGQPCSFVTALGEYLCIEAAAAVTAGDTVVDDADAGGAIPAMTALVTITGATFGANDVGRYIALTGYADATNNGEFPIVSLGAAANQIVIANPLAVTGGNAGGTYTVLSGAGPTPVKRDGLDDGTTAVGVTLEGTGDVEGFTTSVAALGEGFDLNDATASNLTAMPVDGSAVSFDCSGTGGDCGAEAGVLKVMVVNGYTTDTAVTGLPPHIMPPPTTKYATFRCASPLGSSTSITMAAGAMAEIMGTSPTRIETRVFRFSGDVKTNADTTNATNVVVGHGLVGWTTP